MAAYKAVLKNDLLSLWCYTMSTNFTFKTRKLFYDPVAKFTKNYLLWLLVTNARSLASTEP